MLKLNNIDLNKYNSDKVYKIIKKFKIPYNTLTKDSILNLIINFDKNSKTGKVENGNFLLKQKTMKKKPLKDKENLYSEKINKRKISSNKSKIIKTIRKKEENSEISEDSDYDSSNSDTYSVKLKKNTKPEKKLKLKNGKFY